MNGYAGMIHKYRCEW